jgi:hypothetical protein
MSGRSRASSWTTTRRCCNLPNYVGFLVCGLRIVALHWPDFVSLLLLFLA